jgi:hypothetical protein
MPIMGEFVNHAPPCRYPMPKGGKGNESLLTPQKWAGKGNESPQNETKFLFFLLFISLSNMFNRLRQKNKNNT